MPDAHDAPEYRGVLRWLERVAKKANLCISIWHLAELRLWKGDGEATGLAAWLDLQPLVWANNVEHLLECEAECWLKVAVGARASPIDVWAPSMASALKNLTVLDTIEAVAERNPCQVP